MSKINIRKTGLNALSEPLVSAEVSEEIFLGALVGYDNGKLKLADNTSSILAVGVCTKGDFPEALSAYTLEPTGAKRLNKQHLAVETLAVLENPEDLHGIKRGQGKIGQFVYLGDAGKFTLTKGTSKQIVGTLVDNRNRVAVRIFINGFEA